jgi:hypothetical protein
MNFVVGCSSNPGISNNTEDNTIGTSVTPIISTLNVSDSAGASYDFDINMQIQKQFIERMTIDIEKIIEFALLPK